MTLSEDKNYSCLPSRELPWIVQKFGGTSIGKFPTKVVEDIVGSQRRSQCRAAVVCSARSDASKDQGTTSRLLQALQEAQVPHSRDFEATISSIGNEHIKAATAAIRGVDIVHKLAQEIEAEISQVLIVLRRAQKAHSFTEQTRDFVVSRGEKLSCLFMTALLHSFGIEATCIDLSDLFPIAPHDTTSPNLSGRTLYDAITIELAIRIEKHCKHSIPVITGFFGQLPGGLLKTIGRGYSDLCAALVAVALGAQELQIWKEVDGVFNADPRKVPAAALLESISPSEAAELAFYGAEVIHPSTMEHVMRANIPICVKNVLNPESPGTRIDPVKKIDGRRESRSFENGSVRVKGCSNNDTNTPQPKPVAVSIKQHMLVINIQTHDRNSSSSSYLAKIFSIVEQHRLRVDLVSSSEMNISLALGCSEQVESAIYGTMNIEDDDLRSAFEDFNRVGTVDVLPGMAVISLIGDGLKQMVGISAEFFRVLSENDINIEMISQGASETNISAVIEGHETDRALIAVHRNLFKILPKMSYPRIAGGKGLYLGA